ncbi:hypothetical protein FHT86_003272 [Rhizobium sp. BK313]|nr:hypothetical protein [Rhizobium sp. BK313]
MRCKAIGGSKPLAQLSLGQHSTAASAALVTPATPRHLPNELRRSCRVAGLDLPASRGVGLGLHARATLVQ